MIPANILAALHQSHERFFDTKLIDHKEFINWALAANPDAQNKLLQAFEAMFPPDFYLRKPGAELATLLDLLDRMIAIDEVSVSRGLDAFGTSTDGLRDSLISAVLSSP
jgi:hypothetical protein